VLVSKEDISKLVELCGAEQKELRRVCMIGAGRIGTIVAEKLMGSAQKASGIARLFTSIKARRNFDFVIIDSDDELTKAASECFPDARVMRADATDEAFLRDEGIVNFDLAICTTHNHEMNIVMAAFIESLGVNNSICLVSSSAFVEIAHKLEIEVAVPLRDTVVDSIMSHLRGSSVTGIHTVTDGTLEILEITVSEKSQVIGKTLKDIAENGKFLILMVQKQGESNYIIPNGNTELSLGDNLVLITTSEDNQHILEKFGAES
jgi:trk system potassium uptake protein TrkA